MSPLRSPLRGEPLREPLREELWHGYSQTENPSQASLEPLSDDDGTRILVERLWPRGLTKEKAAIDLWLKEVAPQPRGSASGIATIRHGWDEFRKRYRAEIEDNGEVLSDLNRRLKEGPVTFVYAAKDELHNSALVLKEYLERTT